MQNVTLRRGMALLAIGILSAGCVTIGPISSAGVPSLSPGASVSPIASGAVTPEPTRKPRRTPTIPPVATPTTEPTATPTTEPSATPTTEPTATATTSGTATPPPTLNFSLPAVYGSTALTSGFVPDPFSVGITAGGPANVSYLGGGCSGNATAAPAFSVNYTSGSFPLLRFYFIGTGDTTMIINTPGGSYVCVDDSFGTLNPTIDFNSPSSGRYDVWVATFAADSTLAGTLYATENSGNHP